MENQKSRTYKELVQEIKTVLDRQGLPSKDSRYPEKMIYDVLLDMRTSYMKRTKIARQGIGQENVQTIPCVELETADIEICPCQPPEGCVWLKSTKPIPKTISIFSVTNTTAEIKASYCEWSQIKTKLNSRAFRPENRYFSYLDTGSGPYLYLYNDEFIKSVSITGLWENPNYAATFVSCNEETPIQEHLRCNPLDTPLYCDGDMVDVIFKMTVDFLTRTVQGSTPDIYNNSLDDTAGINQTV